MRIFFHAKNNLLLKRIDADNHGKFDKPEDSYRENNHRIRAGNPGSITNDFGAKISNQKVNTFIYKTIDKINYLEPFNQGTVPWENTRDFIKFYFNLIILKKITSMF